MMLDILLCISRYFRSIPHLGSTLISGAHSSQEHSQSRHLTDFYMLLTSQEARPKSKRKRHDRNQPLDLP